MTATALYRWPPAARFGRVVPKTKFYEHGNITASVRETFIADVQRITWAYKLADSTIHLRGDHAVPEIQVFIIDAKENDVSDVVLVAIDRTVQYPIIFEINHGLGDHIQTRMAASHKQLDGPRPKMSAYFATQWLPADSPRVPMPTALDLSSLYTPVLAPILPVAARPGEQIPDTTVRIDQARKLEREIKALERRLRNERQFNRQVEIRRQLLVKTAKLDRLLDETGSYPEDNQEKDAQWTS